MPAPIPEVRMLIAYRLREGMAALEALETARQADIVDNSGRQMVSVSAGGKSFTYDVTGVKLSDLMRWVREAIEYCLTYTEAELRNYTERAPVRSTRVGFL